MFWKELAAEHSDSIATFGLDDVKRRQALRYFTWQWRWRHIHKSEQMRFLLRHSRVSALVRALWRPGSLGDQTWESTPWSKPDRWLFVFATRLLWSYASGADHPALQLEEPRLGNPLPVYWNGRLISQDLANTSLELDALGRGGGGEPREIVEIGAGYGRTAHALLSLHPGANYTIVDIEPTISISRWYLTQLFDPARLTFVPADEVDRLDDRQFDVGISISSLQEMTPDQVRDYLALLDRTVSGHVYLKQWQHWHNPVDDADMIFGEYPFPAGWRRTLWERCPVQTNFMQGVWRTPSD
jgi:putative sugar O-methyltransferase